MIWVTVRGLEGVFVGDSMAGWQIVFSVIAAVGTVVTVVILVGKSQTGLVSALAHLEEWQEGHDRRHDEWERWYQRDRAELRESIDRLTALTRRIDP